MAVDTNIAAGYLSAFEGPIGVSVQSKLTKWPILQLMGFAGSLVHHNQTFHGVKDFNVQMGEYSSTNGILSAAWNVIKQLAPSNPSVLLRMFPSPILGMVGTEFQALPSFGEAFAVSPDQLKQPGTLQAAMDNPNATATVLSDSSINIIGS